MPIIHKQCKRCIMDSSASDIKIDDQGICNYCKEYLSDLSEVIFSR